MEKETEEDFFEASRQRVNAYIKDRVTLLKLQAVEKSSQLVAKLFVVALLALLGVLVILFIGLTGAWFFAQLTHSTFLGFAIMTGIYLVIGGIIFWQKKSIEKAIVNAVIAAFLDLDRDEPELQKQNNNGQ
jgi:cytochrome c biogenesis protein CcdA